METVDWSKLSFTYMKTDYNVRCYWRNGQWGELEVSSSEYIPIHMAATCLHYGQDAFEGLKAFRGKDGRIRIFRLDENAKRMQSSADCILMQRVPEELFKAAVLKAVKMNERFVPPYESGASLYIRPLLIGTGARIGVNPADEYLFVVFVMPVGPYFKNGFKPSNVVIMRQFDRAAPLGTGHVKVGGNYAASLRSGQLAHDQGYAAVLYLDAKEKKYLDECGPANFFLIKGNKYVTPASGSILPSITNKSIQQIAADLGLEVDRRRITVEEMAGFDEAGECGTAAVISPVGRIDDPETGKQYVFSKDGEAGPVCRKLYDTLRGIQYGDLPDKFGWITYLDEAE